MKNITIHKALEFIKTREGKIFSIKFLKRTTGEERMMVCRQGVTAGLAEEPKHPGLNFSIHELIPVYDMQKADYRSIPIEGIRAIKMDGDWCKVTFPKGSI